jgi:hypothetical protein
MDHADWSDVGKMGFLFSYLWPEAPGERALIMFFTNFIESVYDGRGWSGNAEERRGEERATEEVLLACLFV